MILTTIHYRSKQTGETCTYARPITFDDTTEANLYVRTMDSTYPEYIHTWQQVDIGVTAAAEAVTQLSALDVDDPESSHREAEYILCKVIRTVGPEYAAVADAFNEARDRVGFWYS